MKKYHLLLLQILVAAAVLVGVPFKTSAQSYRGFIDIEPVVEFWKVPQFNNLPSDTNYDEEQILTFAPSLATIHGVQWRKFFIGLGAQGIVGIPTSDCYMTSEKQNGDGYNFRYRYEKNIADYISIPVFLCLRFDFFGTSKNNFFIEARGGTSIAFQKGTFGQVIIGGRRYHGKNHGVSYGLILRARQMELWSSPDPTSDSPLLYNVHTKFNALGVGFHLGFDF